MSSYWLHSTSSIFAPLCRFFIDALECGEHSQQQLRNTSALSYSTRLNIYTFHYAVNFLLVNLDKASFFEIQFWIWRGENWFWKHEKIGLNEGAEELEIRKSSPRGFYHFSNFFMPHKQFYTIALVPQVSYRVAKKV